LFVQVDDTITQILNGTSDVPSTIGDFTAYAAETIDNENRLLWVNTETNQIDVWVLNADWVRTWELVTTAQYVVQEDLFEVDVDEEPDTSLILNHAEVGLITRRSDIENGWVTLDIDGTIVEPKIIDGTTKLRESSSRQVLATKIFGGVRKMLIKHPLVSYLYVWTLNSSWVVTSEVTITSLTTDAALLQEALFGVDTHLESRPLYYIIESRGNTMLLKNDDDELFVLRLCDKEIIPVMDFDGTTQLTTTLDTTFTPYAAETINGDNRLLLVSDVSIQVWVFDSSWVRTLIYESFSSMSPLALQYELDFGVDIHEALPDLYTRIEDNGITQVLSVPSLENVTYSTLAEFNIKDSFLDLVKTSVLDDVAYNVQIKLPVPRASFTKASLPVGQKAYFNLETPASGTGIKPMPIGFLGYKQIRNTTDSVTGTEGADYVLGKDNSIITSDAFQGINDVIQVEVLAETDASPLYIKNVTTESYIPLTSLSHNTTTQYSARCTNGDVYDGKTVTYGLAYPSWWLSPAFTRNNIKNLKRMSHFYAVFENSVPIQTNTTLAPSWVTSPKMNLAIVQNGSRTGQSSTAVTDESDPFDILSTSDAGLDYYRVVYPIEGNFVSFQAFVYSFDDGNWELVGYQLEADTSGKTSRKPYD
jgi:hypothetical protein